MMDIHNKGFASIVSPRARRRLMCLVLTIFVPVITLAKIPGDSTLQTGVGMYIGSDGVFIIGREELIDEAFLDYLRSALEAFRQGERISVDINYCSGLPSEQFCNAYENAPQPTVQEKEVLGETQFMTVGYGGAYRHADGWCLKTADACMPVRQPPSYYHRNLGALLFEVDYWLKTWVIGKDPDTNMIPSMRLPWLRPLKEYVADAIVAGETFGTGRTWFSVLDSTTYALEQGLWSHEDSAGHWFHPAEIPLCVEDDKSLTCDDASADVAAAGAFASDINSGNRLSELQQHYSPIAQMVQAAHAVVVAKWLSENKADIELHGNSGSVSPPRTRVKMRLAESERVNFKKFSGGVVMDPAVSSVYINAEEDDGTFEAIAQSINQRPNGAIMWTARLKGGEETVRVLRIGA